MEVPLGETDVNLAPFSFYGSCPFCASGCHPSWSFPDPRQMCPPWHPATTICAPKHWVTLSNRAEGSPSSPFKAHKGMIFSPKLISNVNVTSLRLRGCDRHFPCWISVCPHHPDNSYSRVGLLPTSSVRLLLCPMKNKTKQNQPKPKTEQKTSPGPLKMLYWPSSGGGNRSLFLLSHCGDSLSIAERGRLSCGRSGQREKPADCDGRFQIILLCIF